MSHWSQRLIEAMNDESLVFIKTDELVVIRDKFPKAKHHFLILPTNKNIDNIYDLRKEDIQLINEMELLATNVVEVLGKSIDIFKLGFHAEPSMARLHLHLISTDFNSACLKHKKHWNSFNTEFFLPTDYVKRELELHGKLTKMEDHLLKNLINKQLKCNFCNYSAVTFPNHKYHLLSHEPKE
ncbi:unnamed protein product [Diamesa hyperborea]